MKTRCGDRVGGPTVQGVVRGCGSPTVYGGWSYSTGCGGPTVQGVMVLQYRVQGVVVLQYRVW